MGTKQVGALQRIRAFHPGQVDVVAITIRSPTRSAGFSAGGVVAFNVSQTRRPRGEPGGDVLERLPLVEVHAPRDRSDGQPGKSPRTTSPACPGTLVRGTRDLLVGDDAASDTRPPVRRDLSVDSGPFGWSVQEEPRCAAAPRCADYGRSRHGLRTLVRLAPPAGGCTVVQRGTPASSWIEGDRAAFHRAELCSAARLSREGVRRDGRDLEFWRPPWRGPDDQPEPLRVRRRAGWFGRGHARRRVAQPGGGGPCTSPPQARPRSEWQHPLRARCRRTGPRRREMLSSMFRDTSP